MKRSIVVLIIVLIFSIFAACGSSNSMHVTKEVVTLEQLKSMCNNPDTCKGYTVHYDVEGYRYCTIYMLPYEMYATYNKHWYLTHEESYLLTYGHEMSFHCEKGERH